MDFRPNNSPFTAFRGSGYSLSLKPPAGGWELVCRTPSGLRLSRTIVVRPVAYRSGEDRLAVTNGSETSVLLDAGSYFPFVVSLAETEVLDIDFDAPAAAVGCSRLARPEIVMEKTLETDWPYRDPPVFWDRKRSASAKPLDAKARGARALAFDRSLGDERSFLFTNPFDTADYENVGVRLIHQEDGYQVWMDAADMLGADDSAALIGLLSMNVFPRLESVWGKALDVDGDGAIAVFLTSRINRCGKILGFFNPLDCLTRNTDPLSADYNPGSNETDIVYAAVPEPGSETYSVSSVAATVAHELRHVVHFERKTLRRLWNGETDVPEEDTFLDEGLSHLAESLCGLGESGGNLAFVKRWSDDTAAVSFGGLASDGSADSAGKRGGMAAFLWFLFNRAGGADWSRIPPADTGGFAFLRSLIDSPAFGWDVICAVAGASRQVLLGEFAATINRGRMDGRNVPEIVYDPITGEPISVTVYRGPFVYRGQDYILDGPAAAALPRSVAPLSLGFFGELAMPRKTELTMIQSKTGQQLLWGFGMR